MKNYQKIYGDHKREVQDIYEGHLIVEEKIDGSQFRIEIDEEGRIFCGSHHQELSLTGSNFKLGTEKAQEVLRGLKAENGDVISIFCEYLAKPKQNVIPYARVPRNHLVMFDAIVQGKYLDREEKERFAFNIGLECVPLLWRGPAEEFTEEVRKKLLKTKSFLGHQKGYDRIEGIVIKNYGKYYDLNKFPWLEGQFMATKIVNEEFKEINKRVNPRAGDKLQALKDSMRSEARWRKAVQHLKEKNELVNDMQDLAKLAPEVVRDIEEEEKEIIKDELWKLYGKSILQASVKGLPQWYQERLREENKK